ncbi:hypothetical protein MJG53_014722 [Ovis ammon polii x Ovis aries]|uniref:Uncharacterized protein n=2 Tax=Ovis TaxID=9935 RepID=A0A835ZRE2_SHEEP|nr:hypothetical protein JEQ12_007603 [Ovis aries]KAI4569104.1 hypothetical protein MJG53_014722 [Ovis ammon polii x Ovis aries]
MRSPHPTPKQSMTTDAADSLGAEPGAPPQPPEQACARPLEDRAPLQLLRQELCRGEESFVQQSQNELQQIRLSFERKKMAITEVPPAGGTGPVSDPGQEGPEDGMQREGTAAAGMLRGPQRPALVGGAAGIGTEPSAQGPPPRVPRPLTTAARRLLALRLLLGALLACTAAYVYVVDPAPFEGLVPPLLSRAAVWKLRALLGPFLRLEVDGFLPF